MGQRSKEPGAGAGRASSASQVALGHNQEGSHLVLGRGVFGLSISGTDLPGDVV